MERGRRKYVEKTRAGVGGRSREALHGRNAKRRIVRLPIVSAIGTKRTDRPHAGNSVEQGLWITMHAPCFPPQVDLSHHRRRSAEAAAGPSIWCRPSARIGSSHRHAEGLIYVLFDKQGSSPRCRASLRTWAERPRPAARAGESPATGSSSSNFGRRVCRAKRHRTTA